MNLKQLIDHPVLSVKFVTLIRTKTKTGIGTIENPYRLVFQYWTQEGKLVFTVDSLVHVEEGYIDIG